MKNITLRIFLVLLITSFQLSFLSILLPTLPVPILPLVAVVAWSLVSGFPKGLGMTVPLILLFEFLTNGGVGALSLYAVGLAYATSFLSRRTLIERQGLGLFVYGLFSAGGVIGYHFFGLLWLIVPESLAGAGGILPPLVFSFSQMLLTGLLALLFFMGTYSLVKRFEKYLEQTLQRQFSEVK